MEHSPVLVSLVVATVAALLGILLSTWLRQSAILGYILAGIAIGPFTPGLIGNVEVVQALADVGVIFLLFAIGVEISLRDLLAHGRVAIVGGTAQVLLLIGLGSAAGLALGWTPFEAVFFGSAVAISSSTVLVKMLGESRISARSSSSSC
jgi:CPA2 family monovalent cation:H+ antiporter-2